MLTLPSYYYNTNYDSYKNNEYKQPKYVFYSRRCCFNTHEITTWFI